ncbi:uncharacterized protein LOC109810454 [Cajanus cajan]|uniref:uncharacterized protein LOC109810454 n=1 Tax=Cajanus cajan TaxID=3821 RepID=UPI00098D787F|nr:uncharacterized protein LOC109810454 [Cajanus cajan]
MLVALSVKNKISFVDSSLPKPTIDDPTYAMWIRGNNVVISWLYNFVSNEIITNILFVNTAKEIWDDLKSRFSRKNGPRIFQLKRQLMSLQQGINDVSTIKSIWEELSGYKPSFPRTCGGLQHLQFYNELEYVMSFLMGLNDSFSPIHGQILLSDPLPLIGNALSLVLQEETQREIDTVVTCTPFINSDNMAFLVNSSTKSSTTDHNKINRKERPKCAYCGILGHTKDKCYKLVGYPPNYSFKNWQTHVANQVLDNPESLNQNKSDNLTPAQCQQLINFLTNQMKLDNPVEAIPTNVTREVHRNVDDIGDD